MKIMKKQIYITLFTLLGLLMHFLIIESIATLYIYHASHDFPSFVYQIIFPAWLALGVLSGFYQGKFFWQKIYVERIKKENIFNRIHKKR